MGARIIHAVSKIAIQHNVHLYGATVGVPIFGPKKKDIKKRKPQLWATEKLMNYILQNITSEAMLNGVTSRATFEGATNLGTTKTPWSAPLVEAHTEMADKKIRFEFLSEVMLVERKNPGKMMPQRGSAIESADSPR